MKKILLFSIAILGLKLNVNAQWSGATNATSPIYRTGNVAIGTTAAVSSIPLVVLNSTSGQGTKAVFGATSLIGTLAATDGVFQLQSTGLSMIDLKGQVASTKYLSATIGVSTSKGFEINYNAVGGLTQIPLIITGNGTERLRITPTGQVGIGTGSASLGTNKLAVEGTIACRELKVTLATTWPDYVFENTYERMSLNELDEYLEKNKHLPHLTAAKEIEAVGNFNVGQTQVQMLRSLEELYLYVIELKKENETLKKDIEVLKNKK